LGKDLKNAGLLDFPKRATFVITDIGRPQLQKFVEALAGHGAKKGIFITTSNFTWEAIEYTPRNETKIVIINGEQLAQFMIDSNIGCTPQQTYELKKWTVTTLVKNN
jgi:restriction endonuclease Mrr